MSDRLRIGFDIQSTVGQKTGLGVYTENLTRTLKDIDKKNEYFYFSRKSEGDLRTHERLVWENLGLPFMTMKKKLDIFHMPAFAPPRLKFTRLVVTVHDLIGMIYPENLSRPARFYWNVWMSYAASKADIIIAISENTKKDIIKYLKVPGEKIKVIYPAAKDYCNIKFSKDESAQTLRKLKVPDDYILYAGTIEPRKNLGRVIEAFTLLRKTDKFRGKLVLSGLKGWAYAKLSEMIKEKGIEESVVIPGYVSEEELAMLYQNARLFVFPSLYEGFGMPVIEAMSAHTPVVTSKTSSLGEIAKGAAFTVDPEDEKDIWIGMREVLRDSALRKRLVEKGEERAKSFSWLRCANETVRVYDEVMR